METETDVLVIGGGLAGLGVATALGEEFGVKVVVLDKCSPNLDGNDRFRKDIGASFKNAGMFDIGSTGPGIREYFSCKTADLYKAAGVELREEGAYVMAASKLNSLVADVLLERVNHDDFQNDLEPNVKLASANEAVLKFSKGSQAEPEAAMKVLIEKAQSIDNVEIRFGENVSLVEFNHPEWRITTESEHTYKAQRLVLAAGPQTAKILTQMQFYLPVEDVYGVMSQSNELAQPWLKGSILGAKSYVEWFGRSLCACLCGGGNSLEATSSFGASNESWTTHLYLNVHNNRIYLGGPRVALPYGHPPEATDPTTYTQEMGETEAYSRRLVKYPEGTSFEVDQTWGGIMAFPKDRDYPVVGRFPKWYNETMFLSTGFASAGFREAYGAGFFLATLMEQGEEQARALVGAENGRDLDKVFPGDRMYYVYK